MRILDADIFAYALYDQSPAHQHAWQLVEKGLLGELKLYVTHTTILEVYNVLYWFYRVRPARKLLEKLSSALMGLEVVEPSLDGVELAKHAGIPLGDGFLIATALKHNIPIVVSNDAHIAKKAPEYGLIVETPIPEEVRRRLREWKPPRYK